MTGAHCVLPDAAADGEADEPLDGAGHLDPMRQPLGRSVAAEDDGRNQEFVEQRAAQLGQGPAHLTQRGELLPAGFPGERRVCRTSTFA